MAIAGLALSSVSRDGRQFQEDPPPDARARLAAASRRRRFVATTDSDHDNPIFPDLARDRDLVDGPNQLWVADITYIAIATGFVYLAAILDAWSRRVVGYAISRSIDARVAVAALKAAIRERRPPLKGCIHHSGSWFAIRLRTSIPTCWPNMVSSALWADVAIPMTMPRPKAS